MTEKELTILDIKKKIDLLEKGIEKEFRILEKDPNPPLHFQVDYGSRGVNMFLRFDCINIKEFDRIVERVKVMTVEHRRLRSEERRSLDSLAVERRLKALLNPMAGVMRHGF